MKLLTQKEVNCFALYLSRNNWSIQDIAKLLDISEESATSKIYSAMELEGKINIRNPIPYMLMDRTTLNYELDAEFYLGEAYTNLYYMNHTNIEEVANYIKTNNDDDIPPEIILSPVECQNDLWRSKIYNYACNIDNNKLSYKRARFKLKKIIESGIDGFEFLNTKDNRLAGLDFVQERINSDFKKVMDMYRNLRPDFRIPECFHDIRALAKGFILIDNNFRGDFNFSNSGILKNFLRGAKSDIDKDYFNFEEWPEYKFYFKPDLSNILERLRKTSAISMIANFEKGVMGDNSFYNIYKTFKKISGIGSQNMSYIFWWIACHSILREETNERRERLINIRNNEAKKIIEMPIEEANAYLEAHYGKGAHL